MGLGPLLFEFMLVAAGRARSRGHALGPEWGPIFERTRAFAEKVGAHAWLAELERIRAS